MENHKNVRGIHIRTFNYVMMLTAAVLYLFVIYETVQVSVKYHELMTAMENYVKCESAAKMLEEGADILTEQVRFYAVTGDTDYVKGYFTEAQVSRKREAALELLEQHHPNDEAHSHLRAALEHSYATMEREYYCMKLVTTAKGYPLSDFPEELQEAELTAEDQALDSEAQMKRARELVFDAAYQQEKQQIENEVEDCLVSILAEAGHAQLDSAESLQVRIRQQRICISLLFVMNIIIFLFITMLIVKPLQIYIKCINDKRMLEVVGAYEFNYLALTYNSIYEINSANETMLRRKAEVDALTGIMNRNVFEQLRLGLREHPVVMALLLVDVDWFKTVNDRYGHETGDKVLRRVAELLKHSFRSTDFVARIGGDEFAVIMTEISEDMRNVILHKVEEINQALKCGEDGLPEVSISVGVAFSDCGFDDSLYKRADTALYYVKEHGRSGCEFYQDHHV